MMWRGRADRLDRVLIFSGVRGHYCATSKGPGNGAEEKNSKKDLEKRVAKLKKKVATLTTSLSKKQSDLSRVLSSVQKQLDKLRKQNASGKERATQGDRQQELLQTTESLVSQAA